MDGTDVILFVLMVLGIIAVFGGGLFFTILTLLMRASGWHRLAERFSYTGPPPQSCWKRQTIRMGAVRFRNSMTIGISPAGLYLHTRFARRDLLIPWTAFRTAHPATIYWQSAQVLSIGSPEIANISLFEPQLQLLRPYLPLVKGLL